MEKAIKDIQDLLNKGNKIKLKDIRRVIRRNQTELGDIKTTGKGRTKANIMADLENHLNANHHEQKEPALQDKSEELPDEQIKQNEPINQNKPLQILEIIVQCAVAVITVVLWYMLYSCCMELKMIFESIYCIVFVPLRATISDWIAAICGAYAYLSAASAIVYFCALGAYYLVSCAVCMGCVCLTPLAALLFAIVHLIGADGTE